MCLHRGSLLFTQHIDRDGAVVVIEPVVFSLCYGGVLLRRVELNPKFVDPGSCSGESGLQREVLGFKRPQLVDRLCQLRRFDLDQEFRKL